MDKDPWPGLCLLKNIPDNMKVGLLTDYAYHYGIIAIKP
jgi:hypothetical protein